jgi:hypothetical protein
VDGFTGSLGNKGPTGDQGPQGPSGTPLPPAVTFLSSANQEGYGNERWVFENRYFDTINGYDQLTGLFTAQESGYYFVHMNGITDPLAEGAISLWFQVNGSALLQGQFLDYVAPGFYLPKPIRMSTIVHLEQGDAIGVWVSNAGGYSTLKNLPRLSNFGIFLIGK